MLIFSPSVLCVVDKGRVISWPLTAPLLYLHSNFSTLNASMQFDGVTSVAGKIVITSSIVIPRSVWYWIQELQAAGARAVVRLFRHFAPIPFAYFPFLQILAEGTNESLGYLEMGRPPAPLNGIPVFGITDSDFEGLAIFFNYLELDTLYATISDDGEVTAWRRWLWSPIVWSTSIILATTSAVSFGVSTVKFIQYTRHVGFKSLPSVCLLFNMMALSDMTISWGVDPMGQRQVMTTLTLEAMRIVPIPFLGSTMLLLIFYWHETLRPTRLHFTFNIDRFRLPASLVSFAFFVVTALSIINRSIGIRSANSSWIFKVTMSLFTLPILLFFLITSFRIIQTILRTRHSSAARRHGPISSVTDTTYRIASETGELESRRAKWEEEAQELEAQLALKRAFYVAIKLSGIAICLIAVVVAGIMMLAPQFNAWEPLWTYYLWLMMHAGFVSLTLWCISIFKNIR